MVDAIGRCKKPNVLVIALDRRGANKELRNKLGNDSCGLVYKSLVSDT